jgi:predicted GIY-YIG superfamily endonuclease
LTCRHYQKNDALLPFHQQSRNTFWLVMPQMLLFPDPRPLVERLGADFFRQAPECAGVYLMRDSLDNVLYVGKARNLKKRLASYRVANPDRLRRRHLRLLHSVARIELRECTDEVAALATESELLQRLRPRFNRAGTWPAPKRLLIWRISDEGIAFSIRTQDSDQIEQDKGDWHSSGPLGSSVFGLQAALVRLCWCAIHPERGLRSIPQGWFHYRQAEPIFIRSLKQQPRVLPKASLCLSELFTGYSHAFSAWIHERTTRLTHPFEVAVRKEDLELLEEFAAKQQKRSALL